MYLYALLLMAFVGLVNLAIGWLLGRLWPHGGAKTLSQDKLRELTRQLAEQIACVSRDIQHHQGQIDEAHQGLLAVHEDEDASMPLLLASVAEIVRINAGLQSKLGAAEETLKEQGRQIESWSVQALTDPLTSLPNRRAFDEALARRLAEWRRTQTAFSVMLIDADHFKLVNDRHGHFMGDFVLRRLAEVLEASTRKMDLIARVGGEEFAIILPSTPGPSARCAAEHCHAAVAAYNFRHEEVELHMTVSVGLASVARSDDDESLLRRADEALYAAKHAGRDCVFYHNGLNTERVGAGAACGNGSCTKDSTESPDVAFGGTGDLDRVCRELSDRAAQLFGA